METRNQIAIQARREALYWKIGKTLVFAIFILALGAVINMAQAGYDLVENRERGWTPNSILLTRTYSEEFTVIQHLAAQQQQFREMNTELATTVARMYGRWIDEHKSGLSALQTLIRSYSYGNVGNVRTPTVHKHPVLSNDPHVMLHATMVAHMQAVQTSQSRHGRTNSLVIKNAMHNRANLARKHMREMMPIHGPQNCPKCADMISEGHAM